MTPGDLTQTAESVALRWDDLSSEFASAALACSAVAMDSETTGLDWRTAELKLVQVRVPGVGTELVRLRSGSASTNLVTLLGEPATVKIFHHAMFDLGFMFSRWACPIESIACTKIAAKLLWPGERERHGLQALARDLLGVALDKGEQVSDWASPTLRSAQLEYAAMDVRYLHDLMSSSEKRLRESGLWELALGCWTHVPYRVQLEAMGVPDPFVY